MNYHYCYRNAVGGLSVLSIIFLMCAMPTIMIFDSEISNNKNNNSNNRHQNNDIPKHSFDITKGFIIALYPNTIKPLLASAQSYLHIPVVDVFHAINGSVAMTKSDAKSLSLYTQYLMTVSGRHDHMQLSSPAMLGCFLSHAKIWQTIRPGEVFAVFEEDAYIDEVSAERMHSLSNDMRDIHWDVLLLESGHRLIASGKWQHIGKYAATCSTNSTTPCTWFGTRGYLITYAGAQELLRHAFPISVQVDALMGLVAAFSRENFRMYWTRENIAHLQLFHVTEIWDACVKCYLPTSPVLYILWVVSFAMMMFIHCCCHHQQAFFCAKADNAQYTQEL